MPRDPHVPRLPRYIPRDPWLDRYEVEKTNRALIVTNWWREREMKAARSRHFTLRTRVENHTPYHTLDLMRLTHRVARFAGGAAARINRLRFVSDTKTSARFDDIPAGHATIWIDGTAPDMLELIDDLRWIYGLTLEDDMTVIGLRERTAALRCVLNGALKITLRRHVRRTRRR